MEMTDKWQPDKKDIKQLCCAILDHYIEEDLSSCDRCIFCSTRYGNVHDRYHKHGKQEPHDSDCPVLVARDVMTGIDKW